MIPAIGPVIGAEIAEAVILTHIFATIEYDNLTKGRWFDVQPFEKNSIVKRKNFWGQYYTRTWTNDEYGSSESAWNDDSYYLSEKPSFLSNINIVDYPFHPKNSRDIPAKIRYDNCEKRTISRYDNNEAFTTYYVECTQGDSLSVPEDISPDLIQDGNFVIPQGCAVYIQSGAKIKFPETSKLEVLGSLYSKNVIFTKKSTATGWDGIHFGYSGGPTNYANSKLDSCEVSYGKGIRIFHYDNLEVNYCKIANNCAPGVNGGGVYIYGSEPVINGCTIIDNISSYGGSGIYMACDEQAVQNKKPLITNNFIKGIHGYTGIGINNIKPILINNTIYGYSPAITMQKSYSSILINNVIMGSLYYNNVSRIYDSNPIIRNCLISDDPDYFLHPVRINELLGARKTFNC